jgi:hypothetical protein
MRTCLAPGPGSTHQARDATSQSRSTCNSWSPAAPARSAAAISDVNRSTPPSGRVSAVSSTQVTRARSNSPRSSSLTSRSSGTTTSRRPSSTASPAAPSRRLLRLAEFRGASHRGHRYSDRAPSLRPYSRLLELERDLLMLAREQSCAVPCTAVGLIRQHICQCLMNPPPLPHRRALRDRRANQRMAEAQCPQVNVDDASLDGRRSNVNIQGSSATPLATWRI